MNALTIGKTPDGKTFHLPLELVVRTIAILAMRGVGKTHTASVITEQMLEAHQAVCVIDPTGAWWGLKASADGERPAFPVVVFGGDHADLPIEEGSGEIIARALVDKRISAILDLSCLRKGEQTRFLTGFLETLYRINREPLHLVCDEADAYAPQRPFGDEARVLGAMEDIVRRGRKKGLGCTLITQRPAVLNKNVLTQCDILAPLRIVHPKDIAAIKEWVGVHADPAQAKELIDSLPSLPVGTAWFWSPGWGDILARVAVNRRKTFDSSATPKPGMEVKRPRRLAAIDVAALGDEIAATAARLEEQDPEKLQARIRELDRQLAKPPKVDSAEAAKEFEKGRKAGINEVGGKLSDFGDQLDVLLREIEQSYHDFRQEISDAWATKSVGPAVIEHGPDGITVRLDRLNPGENRPDRNQTAPNRTKNPLHANNSSTLDGKLSKAERTILSILATYGPTSTRRRIALLGSYSAKGGGFNNAVSSLRSANRVTGSDPITITNEGLAVAEASTLPRPGPDLVAHWLGQLPKADRAILAYLADIYPAEATKQNTAAACGYNASGGGFNNAVSRLRTLQLIEGRSMLQASPDLFRK